MVALCKLAGGGVVAIVRVRCTTPVIDLDLQHRAVLLVGVLRAVVCTLGWRKLADAPCTVVLRATSPVGVASPKSGH